MIICIGQWSRRLRIFQTQNQKIYEEIGILEEIKNVYRHNMEQYVNTVQQIFLFRLIIITKHLNREKNLIYCHKTQHIFLELKTFLWWWRVSNTFFFGHFRIVQYILAYLYLFKWNFKWKRFIVVWIQGAFFDTCLLFLQTFAILHQCYLDIRIWKWLFVKICKIRISFLNFFFFSFFLK